MAITHPEAPQVYQPQDPEKQKGRLSKGVKRAIAAVTLTGVLGSGGYALARGEESVSPGYNPNGTSATPDTEAIPGIESPEAIVGQPGSTLENISVRPPEELIQQALEPVTLDKYPTAEAALEQFGKIENIIRLSATVDTEAGLKNIPETPESIELREKLWSNFLSTEGLASYAYKDEKLPAIIAMELWFINESGALSPKETGTWHRDWTIDSVVETGENSYTSEVTKTTITNFGELDDMASQNIPDLAPVMVFTSRVDISHDGTSWSVDYMKQIT